MVRRRTRHSNTLARVIERLMGKPPRRDNPNQPMVVTACEEDALDHLVSRQTTEWNASSSYIVMAAHATGEVHRVIRNLERDEVKHLCILSAASVYLLGPRPWGRFLDLIRKGLENFTIQKKKRSGGEVFGTNPVTAIEGITAHLLTEFFLRRWLKTVPLRTLALVFETQSTIPEPGPIPSAPGREAEIAEFLRLGSERRLRLDRWAPTLRQRALEQRSYEESHAAEIERLVAVELGGFEAAESSGAEPGRQMRKRIARLSRSGGKRLRRALLDRLRGFQLQNSASRHESSPIRRD